MLYQLSYVGARRANSSDATDSPPGVRAPPARSPPRAVRAAYRVTAMRIATWNVNSVKQRLPRLLPWLDERRPDVVCLQ